MAKGQSVAAKPVLKREHILAAIERLESAVEDWQKTEDDGLLRAYRGRTIKAISSAVEEAAGGLFEVCDTCDVEREAWPLVLVVDELDDCMSELAERFALSPQDADPSGGVRMWNCYDRLLKAKSPVENKKPEPIPQLIAEGVSRFQIAKIYGWYLDDGASPDVQKVQDELANPGTHFRADQWQHPSYRRFWRSVEERWQKRIASFTQRAEEQDADREKREAPESVEELLALPNMTAKQIAKMKGITEDEVRKRASELGFALDSETLAYGSYREAQAAAEEKRRQKLQRAMELERLDTYRDLGQSRESIEQRIAMMGADGVRPRDIADALGKECPELTYQQVGQILRKSQAVIQKKVAETVPPDDGETE